MKLPEPTTVRGSAGITAELRRAILGGDYAFNERLPSERYLAEHFGASRGTVREALKRLAAMSMVSRKVGSGTFVIYDKSSNQDMIAEATSPLELIDARLGIETQMVRLAVANATLVDIDRLELALDNVENTDNEASTFTSADMKFHLALAECTRNRLIVWLYQLVNETRGHAQWSAMKDKILTPQRIDEYNSHHRELFISIATRNLNRAVQTIELHLERARTDLVGAVNNR
ncbi:MAG: GntR family transcriptional regulator [Acidiferrobacteraceae bacterium]|nr:GntR family transcriptional regulator [Acidiferrobacteraceae bacterium]